MDAYHSPFSMKDDTQVKLHLSLELNGYCFIIIDLHDQVDQQDCVQQRPSGQTKLTIGFNQNLSEDIIILLYGFFPSLMSIDATRNVYPAIN